MKFREFHGAHVKGTTHFVLIQHLALSAISECTTPETTSTLAVQCHMVMQPVVLQSQHKILSWSSTSVMKLQLHLCIHTRINIFHQIAATLTIGHNPQLKISLVNFNKSDVA